MEAIAAGSIRDAELDMPRQGKLRVHGFVALAACVIIWMQRDHQVFKHPRRSIDLDQQKFARRHSEFP